MKYSIAIVWISLVMNACTPARLVFELEPEFRENTLIYEIKSTKKTWFPKSFNIRFGFYKVARAKLGQEWTKDNFNPFLEDNQVLKSQVLEYQFQNDGGNAWNAYCYYDDRHAETKLVVGPATFPLNSNKSLLWKCAYVRDQVIWYFTVKKNNEGNETISLSSSTENYHGSLIYANAVESVDGKRRITLSQPIPFGYVWSHSGKKLASISTSGTHPYFLVRNDVPPDIAELLAMASTSLLFYRTVTRQIPTP